MRTAEDLMEHLTAHIERMTAETALRAEIHQGEAELLMERRRGRLGTPFRSAEVAQFGAMERAAGEASGATWAIQEFTKAMEDYIAETKGPVQ